MTSPASSAAICILRIESQGAGLLFSLTLSPDISVISAGSRRSFANAEAVLHAIGAFIETFSESVTQQAIPVDRSAAWPAGDAEP